jgi:predicted nucleic acid-binding protein
MPSNRRRENVFVDQGIRARSTHRVRLDQRSLFQDILIAATAREIGATIITENHTDFALIGNHVDIAFVSPFPPTPVA